MPRGPAIVVVAMLAAAVVSVAGPSRGDPGPSRSDPGRPDAAAADAAAAHGLDAVLARIEAMVRALAALDGSDLERAGDAAVERASARAAAALESWLRQSREAAVAAGTRPVPPALRRRLAGFYPPALIDRVRFTVGAGDDRSVQRFVFALGRTVAVTLGDVIVFRDERAAADPVFWAHELTHVQQYERLGMDGFAALYVRDFRDMEKEAWQAASRYSLWALKEGRLTAAELDSFGRF
jgi:hypothetical protein